MRVCVFGFLSYHLSLILSVSCVELTLSLYAHVIHRSFTFQDGQGHVVDLLESGATVLSFIEEYTLAASVEPSVSTAYLLLSLVPQCLSAEAMRQNISPLKFHLQVFLGSLERLHLHVGSFAATRELVRGVVSQYVRDSAVLGVLMAGLGHRVLTSHRRVGEAMRVCTRTCAVMLGCGLYYSFAA
jgi:hypothetical protein